MEDFALLSVQQNLSIDLKRDMANERGDETGQSFVFCLFVIFANVGAAWISRWTRSWIRKGGRRSVTRCQAPNRSRPREEYWLHSVSGRERCLSVVAVSLEREGAAQLKNGLICLEQAYCF